MQGHTLLDIQESFFSWEIMVLEDLALDFYFCLAQVRGRLPVFHSFLFDDGRYYWGRDLRAFDSVAYFSGVPSR